MSDFFSKNFIQINGRYINKNHIVFVKEDREDNEVYIALSNGDQMYFGGTLNQLIEKMNAPETFEEESRPYPVKTELYNIPESNKRVMRVHYSDKTYKDTDVDW